MSQDASGASTPQDAGLCGDDTAIHEAGGGGETASEGAASGLLRCSSSVCSGDTEGDLEGMQSDSNSGRTPCDVSCVSGDDLTPSDNLPLGSPELEGEPSDGEQEEEHDVESQSSALEFVVSAAPALPVSVLNSFVLHPGFDECVLEVQAFKRGGLPGLHRLKRVLPVIFDAFGVFPGQRRQVLEVCGLVPVGMNQSVSFLFADRDLSPSWVRSIRPHLPLPDPSTASVSLA